MEKQQINTKKASKHSAMQPYQQLIQHFDVITEAKMLNDWTNLQIDELYTYRLLKSWDTSQWSQH